MAGLKAVILNFDFPITKQEFPSQLGSSMLKKESICFRILTFHFKLHIYCIQIRPNSLFGQVLGISI